MRDQIRISDRNIKEPKFASPDFMEQFSTKAVERWSRVNTTAGRTVFARIGTDQAVSHEILIRYDRCVTSESWIVLADDTRLRVLDVEDLEERREWMRLLCIDRGDKLLEASKA